MTDTGPALFLAGVVFAVGGEAAVGVGAMLLGTLLTFRERAAAELDKASKVKEQQQKGTDGYE